MLLIITPIIIYFFVGFSEEKEDTKWGVNFSLKQTEFLGIDDKQTYLALIEDLGFKKIKISVHWDLIEKEFEKYDFSLLDWQIQKAKENNAEVILAIGMKTPRWPECHIPKWAEGLEKKDQQSSIVNLIEAIASRYKNEKTVVAWQIENEFFLNFGKCPWKDEDFFKEEIKTIRMVDKNRPVIITDSGELSFWIASSKLDSDILGVTTYKKVWQTNIKKYISYILPPIFYERRANLIKIIFDKEVIGTELQAEPWCANSIMNSSLEEQAKTMDLEQFKKNVNFAKKTGIKEFYFWGGEWWYYMLTKHGDDKIWNEVKNMLN
ncbi:MAG: hypothetical protein WC446_00415 [Candidatus Paceibacterota bacterium]